MIKLLIYISGIHSVKRLAQTFSRNFSQCNLKKHSFSWRYFVKFTKASVDKQLIIHETFHTSKEVLMVEKNNKRFLLMEDDLGVATLLKRKLARLGYEIDHSVNGEQGLKMCAEQHYDMLIIDHKMPVYSGLDVIRKLSELDDPPPAIMVTGAGDESIAVQALKLGAHDYIVKDATSGYMELLPTVIDQVFHKITLEKEKAQAEAALKESESRYRCLVELSPDAIFVLSQNRISFTNAAGVRLLGAENSEGLIGDNQDAYIDKADRRLFLETVEQCAANKTGVKRFESRFTKVDGTRLDVDLKMAYISYEGKPAVLLVARDITSKKRAELEISHMNDELEQVVEDQNKQLTNLHNEMETATKKLNMAQMATGALHNVKNVLNSLIVGTSMMSRILGNSKVGRVGKVAQLLQENQSELGAFLSEGERGKFLPNFLTSLAGNLEKEHDMVHQELQGLIKNLEHIKFSIQLQLSHTRLSEGSEFLNLNEMVTDALDVNKTAIQRNHVVIRREGPILPPIPGNRHKVLQVLVNLIGNGVNALEDVDASNRVMTITTEMPGERLVSVAVSDTGVGISKENLADIFTYGFTTRDTGHGFGLHSCLQLASEMGGSLAAHSDGVGKGASFKLTLPVNFEES